MSSNRYCCLTLVTLIVVGLCAPASAGFVPIDEASLDAIFSQPSFCDTPVDVNFLPSRTLVSPEHVDIDFNSGEYSELFNHPGNDPAPVINIYLVDKIYRDGYWKSAAQNRLKRINGSR